MYNYSREGNSKCERERLRPLKIALLVPVLLAISSVCGRAGARGRGGNDVIVNLP